MLELSIKTKQIIDKLFTDNDKPQVIMLLKNDCGNNLPFCKNATPHQMERIRFAAMKVSGGMVNELKKVIDLAKADWRDLLINAEFANDEVSHEIWANKVLSI